MDKPKVYVTQEVVTANYSDIERFGAPVFLCTSEMSDVTNSRHNERLVGLIRARFRGFNPDTDFIAPSGSPIISGMVFAMARETGDTFNVLKWNNRDQRYTAIRIGVQGTPGVN